MANQKEYIELITLAQKGNRDSLNRLSELSRGYLRTYIYRLTLQEDITEDIVQDTLLEMFRFIDKLKNKESFFSWLRIIAVNKMYSRGKKEGLHRTVSIHKTQVEYSADKICSLADNLSALESGECRQIIMESMRNLRPRHRQVLVMRCYEDLKYSEIAQEIGCSEFNVRVIFHRAKNALRKQLSKRGMSKSLLLPCLYLFGQITKRAKAEIVNISAQSLAAGPVAAVVSSLFTVSGLIVAGLLTAAVGLIAVGTASRDDNVYFAGSPSRGDVKSFYYMEQDWGKTGEFNRNLSRGRSLSRGCYEQWFYFPDGVDGPMFMMMQRWDPKKQGRLCGWLQNSNANYYYNSGTKTIHIYQYNLPLLGLQTRRLPTDSPEFTQFLDSVEGKIVGVDYYSDPNTGLLMGALDNRFSNAGNYQFQITYNTLEKTTFDKFRYEWPEGTPVIDERDAMHKRGWTYFRITGHFGDEQIEGTGRIPFIYDELSEHWPWLKMDIDNKRKLVDCPFGAYVTDADGQITAVYPAGTFFRGLARPWMGMHTIDLVRRDAVEKRIAFDTKISDYNPQESQYEKARVTFFLASASLARTYGNASAGDASRGSRDKKETRQPRMTYSINVTADLVDKIDFLSGQEDSNQINGQLLFYYLNDINDVGDEFAEPEKMKLPKPKETDSPGILWLTKLSQGFF